MPRKPSRVKGSPRLWTPRHPLRLIAFCGLAGHGKTTAAEAIVSAPLSGRWVRLSFADPIRAMLSALGVPSRNLNTEKEVPLRLLGYRTARHAMQTLGTEWGRGQMAPDLWLRVAEHRILDRLANNHAVVIDDCRFTNEAELVHALGGLVILVVNPRGYEPPILGRHASEAGVDPRLIDHTLTAPTAALLRRRAVDLLNPARPECLTAPAPVFP